MILGGFDKLIGNITGSNALQRGYGNATDTLREYYNTSRSDLAPYRDFGTDRLNALKSYLAGPQGTFTPPTMDDVYNSPEFDLGKRAVENSAVARGGLLGGNTLRALQDYSGAQYGNVYNRALTTHATNLNDLLSQLGIGFSAATTGANQALQTGNALAGIGVSRTKDMSAAQQEPWKLAAQGAGAFFGL